MSVPELEYPSMGGPRGVERSPQSRALSHGLSLMKVGPDGKVRFSEQTAKQVREQGMDPTKMTAVQAFAATRLVSEGELGVARIGVPHSIAPVQARALNLANAAKQAVQIRTYVGIAGSTAKHSMAGSTPGLVADVVAIGEQSRHQSDVTKVNVQVQNAAAAVKRQGPALGLSR
jgi:hypothetical protein